MEDWITELANEYTPDTETGLTGGKTEVHVVLASDKADIAKLHKLLISNGFPVLEVKCLEKEADKPMLPGSRVQTSSDVVASTNCLIKTPTALYTIAEAVLPAGYIGEVVGIEKDAATVNFDANIKVTAKDQSGYLSTQDYYVGTLKVDLKDLNVL